MSSEIHQIFDELKEMDANFQTKREEIHSKDVLLRRNIKNSTSKILNENFVSNSNKNVKRILTDKQNDVFDSIIKDYEGKNTILLFIKDAKAMSDIKIEFASKPISLVFLFLYVSWKDI